MGYLIMTLLNIDVLFSYHILAGGHRSLHLFMSTYLASVNNLENNMTRWRDYND